MINWIKRIRPWITLLAEIATIVGVFGGIALIAAIIFLKKAVVSNLGWIAPLSFVTIFFIFRKRLLKFFNDIKDIIRNKPLIDKLKTEIRYMKEENDIIRGKNNKLRQEISDLKTDISKTPVTKTYLYELKNYEMMNWKIIISYSISKDNNPINIETETEDPYCPRCESPMIEEDNPYNYKFICLKNCGYWCIPKWSLQELKDHVQKLVTSDFKKDYLKLTA